MLSIFSLFLLDLLIPHHHHVHDEIVIEQTGAHHHHIDDDISEEDHEHHVFEFLLSLHSHAESHSEFVHTNPVVKKQRSFDYSLLNTILPNSEVVLLSEFKETNKLLNYSPPNLFYNTYIVQTELRGPPVLG